MSSDTTPQDWAASVDPIFVALLLESVLELEIGPYCFCSWASGLL
jgi:hypothetical protein